MVVVHIEARVQVRAPVAHTVRVAHPAVLEARIVRVVHHVVQEAPIDPVVLAVAGAPAVHTVRVGGDKPLVFP